MAGLERHCTRKNNNYKNKMIDPEKTHINYALDNHENPMEYFKERMGQIRINQRREDIKVAASWVITQPREIHQEESRKFFESAHYFLTKKYGEKNIVWSRVHMDESTPHLHFCFMPVTQDKKHEGQEKLCAKDVLNRTSLMRFHNELSASMEKVFGRDIGIETGQTEKNLPLEKLKVKTALDEASVELNAIKEDLDIALRNKLSFIDGRELGERLETEAKKGMFGSDMRLSGELYAEVVKYIWNSGAKDEEISSLGKRLEAMTAVATQAQITEAQRASLASENTTLWSRTHEAEREASRLKTVVAAVEKIDPGVLAKAVEQTRGRERGERSR